VSWHSDNEPELGPQPVVASASFGAERRFELRHKTRKDLKKFTVMLGDGSVLLMSKTTQNNWLHQIPKTPHVTGARINLTFRLICEPGRIKRNKKSLDNA
ncbi:MAG: alpha-ketoglutarate-dependent dioxygenase AlkB, partial [Pseudohongiellaceae bacterium]